jgi:hypothetical protein
MNMPAGHHMRAAILLQRDVLWHLEDQPGVPSAVLLACSIADVANSSDYKALLDILMASGEDVGKPAGSAEAPTCYFQLLNRHLLGGRHLPLLRRAFAVSRLQAYDPRLLLH